MELTGTDKPVASAGFLLAIHEQLVALQDLCELREAEHAAKYQQLLDQIRKGADTQKLLQELTSSPLQANAELNKSLSGTWVEQLLRAIADPGNKTIWVHGGLGKSVVGCLILNCTSVAVLTLDGAYGIGTPLMTKGKYTQSCKQ